MYTDMVATRIEFGRCANISWLQLSMAFADLFSMSLVAAFMVETFPDATMFL